MDLRELPVNRQQLHLFGKLWSLITVSDLTTTTIITEFREAIRLLSPMAAFLR